MRRGVEVTALRGDENNRYKLLSTHGTLRARVVDKLVEAGRRVHL